MAILAFQLHSAWAITLFILLGAMLTATSHHPLRPLLLLNSVFLESTPKSKHSLFFNFMLRTTLIKQPLLPWRLSSSYQRILLCFTAPFWYSLFIPYQIQNISARGMLPLNLSYGSENIQEDLWGKILRGTACLVHCFITGRILKGGDGPHRQPQYVQRSMEKQNLEKNPPRSLHPFMSGNQIFPVF